MGVRDFFRLDGRVALITGQCLAADGGSIA